MDLFPKSNRDIFRRKIISKDSEFDMIETTNPKLQLEQWEKALHHGAVNNDAMLKKEMTQTFKQINEFLYGLEVASTIHDKRIFGRKREWATYQGFEQQLRDKIILGHTLRGKVKELLDLEDSGVRLLKSISVRPSFSETNDLENDSEENISNSRYGPEIKDVLRKFNRVLVKGTLVPQVSDLQILKEQRDPEVERDALEFLIEQLALDNIQPIFISHPLKDKESSHTVSCRVFNTTVEGKASEKSAAKKAAAVSMLERLVEDNAKDQLPPQITPFGDLEVQEAMGILCEAQRYDAMLAEMCLERRKRPPQYTNDSTRHSLRVLCSALSLQGMGTHSNPVMARRLAAREVLLQLRQKPTY
uniref:DRBM domain-containing protein n=1 Tax=Graphocephala atropunctata TaxID=36148 RepID=A0A1B6LK37_9HEMI